MYLAKILGDLGFIPLASDQSIFIQLIIKIVVASHIDDLLIFGPSIKDIKQLRNDLSKILSITDLGDISYFLGIKISRDRAKRLISICQRKFIGELFLRFKKQGIRPVKNPSEMGVRLEKYTETATKY